VRPDTRPAHQETELAEFIERRSLALKSEQTQADIAVQAGYGNRNIVAMTKQGSSRAALDRVQARARALNVDPAYPMGLAPDRKTGDNRGDRDLRPAGD